MKHIFSTQINYLIDEASNVGKGGNVIISMLHHFLKHHNFGETFAHFHAAEPNYSQLVGSQVGISLVPMYNWSGFFEEYTIKTALKGITNMHHFQFSKSYPGKVKVKNTLNDSERTINLLKTSTSWLPTSDDLPNELIPAGLSLERQWYLYEKIREYCPEDVQDLVCPKPSLPKP